MVLPMELAQQNCSGESIVTSYLSDLHSKFEFKDRSVRFTFKLNTLYYKNNALSPRVQI